MIRVRDLATTIREAGVGRIDGSRPGEGEQALAELERLAAIGEAAELGVSSCALEDGAPDDHGFLTCDRCQHCAPPFLIKDWCVA